VEDEPAPTADDAVPGLHWVQVDDPAKLYVPAGHDVHVEGDVARIAVENVPAGHNVHEGPPTSEYVPLSQYVHTEMPENPALQVQLEHTDTTTIRPGPPAQFDPP
jgi:hypothetical protein